MRYWNHAKRPLSSSWGKSCSWTWPEYKGISTPLCWWAYSFSYKRLFEPINIFLISIWVSQMMGKELSRNWIKTHVHRDRAQSLPHLLVLISQPSAVASHSCFSFEQVRGLCGNGLPHRELCAPNLMYIDSRHPSVSFRNKSHRSVSMLCRCYTIGGNTLVLRRILLGQRATPLVDFVQSDLQTIDGCIFFSRSLT